MKKAFRIATIVLGSLLLLLLGLVHFAAHQFEKMSMESRAGILASPPYHSDTIAVDGRSIFLLRTKGDSGKIPLVFVHGSPGSADNFEPYLTDPSWISRFNMMAYDRPGFGVSNNGSPLARLKGESELLHTLLQSQGIQRTWLIGYSYGCSILLDFAVRYPVATAGLVLIAPPADPAQEKGLFLRRLIDLPPVAALLPGTFCKSNKELLPLKDQLAALGGRLGEIRSPVLVIQGTKDNLVPAGNAAYIREHLLNAVRLEIQMLHGSGHMLLWSDAERIKEEIGEFISPGR